MKSFHRYKIAYRECEDQEFKLLDNPEYGWAADPFLVEYDGSLFLFAEIFLYKTERNGKLAYCVYENGEFGQWTITMDKHWHLSYPNVFVSEGKLLMIPESYQLEEVNLYELQSFPDKWKKTNTYIENVAYCDSTMLHTDEREFMFTFKADGKGAGGKLYLYEIVNGKAVNGKIITDRLDGARCGGQILDYCGKKYRVAQNCIPDYGSGLIFYEIDSVCPEYHEHEIKRIGVGDINPEWSEQFVGIHTYNRVGEFEVIDLREKVISEEEELASKRVREIFVNKYRNHF